MASAGLPILAFVSKLNRSAGLSSPPDVPFSSMRALRRSLHVKVCQDDAKVNRTGTLDINPTRRQFLTLLRPPHSAHTVRASYEPALLIEVRVIVSRQQQINRTCDLVNRRLKEVAKDRLSLECR
jgi:hypothetical protein